MTDREAVASVEVAVDPSTTFQTIDGFGVNINAKYWGGGALMPAMQLLVDDLGATIYRLDAYGKSNWIDPRDEFGPSVLNQATYDRVYQGREFADAVAMGAYLNSRGIDPYVTLSGVVPRWMCGPDGVTLTDYVAFAEMCASYLVWLRRQGVRFRLFGPLNETNLGPPEGPRVGPKEFPLVLDEVVKALDRNGLSDIRLVVAEQGGVGPEYVAEMVGHPSLSGRIHAFGVHSYGDEDYRPVVDLVKASAFRDVPVWMSEYGDLDQTGEHEWYFSRVIFRRLLSVLQAGMTAALNWDAFDNYHDHDGAWTIYGIIRTGLRCFTPKKRYYACKQICRYVKPGSVRVGSTCGDPRVAAVAFRDPAGRTVVSGMVASAEPLLLRVRVPEAHDDRSGLGARGLVTSESLDCACVPCEPFRPWNSYHPQGYQITVPANGIFTVTTSV